MFRKGSVMNQIQGSAESTLQKCLTAQIGKSYNMVMLMCRTDSQQGLKY